MAKAERHKWVFRARFRRHAFIPDGQRSVELTMTIAGQANGSDFEGTDLLRLLR